MATNNSNISVKLVVNKKEQRVLFAEAGKDFVDFLFSLLVLPVGTAVTLLENRDVLSGFANLRKSVSDLENDYMYPGSHKNDLLEPKSSFPSSSQSMLLTGALNPPRSTHTYEYESDHDYYWGARRGGFVKGLVTYMVTDDLVVTPMPTVSNITYLKNFDFKNLGAMEEKVVDVGKNEALELLKHSMYSKTNILTDVFLAKDENKKLKV